jgi:hypothetical protein
MFRAGGGTAYQLLGALTGPKSMRRAVATLPVADADIALTGPVARRDRGHQARQLQLTQHWRSQVAPTRRNWTTASANPRLQQRVDRQSWSSPTKDVLILASLSRVELVPARSEPSAARPDHVLSSARSMDRSSWQ